MSFMYESMMSRGPGKRKIKLQEENILRLMQDDDDDDEEEDHDFELNERQAGNASGTDKSDTNDSDSSSSSSSGDSSTSRDPNQSTSSKHRRTVRSVQKRRRNRQPFIAPTVQSTLNRIKSKYPDVSSSFADSLMKAQKQLEISKSVVMNNFDVSMVKICSVCLMKNNPHEILVCNKCGVTVHEGCFGGTPCSNRDGYTRWFCSSCISGFPPNCEFCPSTSGCFKESTNGQWCHIICARYILGKEMYENSDNTDVIDLSQLNYKQYGARECSLCENRQLSKTGICVKCDAGLCKLYFHVTCAQTHGLLSENQTDLNCDTDPYFVYCPLHLGKEEMLKSQKVFIESQAAIDLLRKKYTNQNRQQSEILDEELFKQRISHFRFQRSKYPLAPTPGTPPVRKLTSSATAMRLLNRKAEMMFSIDTQSPAAYFPKPSDIRKRHHVVPALTGEFASHYADRELRLDEMKERTTSVARDNKALMKKQSDLLQQYKSCQEKLSTLQENEGQIIVKSRSLFSMFMNLKKWANENKPDKSDSPRKKTHKFTPLRAAEINLPAQKTKKSPSKKRPSRETYDAPRKSVKTSTSVLLRKCDICHNDKEQHLLVDCDVCGRWLHLSCLDPPLTQMPKKTKFTLWQCSECVSSSEDDTDTDDDSHGSHVTAEGRRHTRRLHKPPEKLSTSLLQDHHMMEQKRMINHINRLFQKSHNKKKRYYRSRLQRAQRKGFIEQGFIMQKPGVSSSSRVIKKEAIRSKHVNMNKKVLDKPSPTKSALSEPLVVVKRDTHLDRASHANTDMLAALGRIMPSYNADATTSSPQKVAAGKITKPVILPTSSALKFPSSAIPIKPIDKVSLSSKYSFVNVTASQSVAEQLRNIVKSLKITSPKLTVHPSSKMNVSPTITSSNTDGMMPKVTATLHFSPQEGSKPQSTVKTNLIASLTKINEEQKAPDQPPLVTPPPPPPECDVCKKSEDGNKMLFCNTCHRHYHIWCCDPPLTLMPRINRFSFWICSNCQESEDDEKDVAAFGGSETTPDGRRKITRLRKPPEKFANIFYSASQHKALKAVLSKRGGAFRSKIKVKTKKPKRLIKTISKPELQDISVASNQSESVSMCVESVTNAQEDSSVIETSQLPQITTDEDTKETCDTITEEAEKQTTNDSVDEVASKPEQEILDNNFQNVTDKPDKLTTPTTSGLHSNTSQEESHVDQVAPITNANTHKDNDPSSYLTTTSCESDPIKTSGGIQALKNFVTVVFSTSTPTVKTNTVSQSEIPILKADILPKDSTEVNQQSSICITPSEIACNPQIEKTDVN